MKTKIKIVMLTLVFLLAFFVRFYNITEVGLKYPDEGTYLVEADKVNGNIYSDYEMLSSMKPLYVFTISGSLKIFGHHDYASLIVSALAGSVTVIIIFLIARLLFSFEIGIISALILALNKYHIIFSRTGLAESLMLLLFCLSLYVYFLSKYSENKDIKSLFLSFTGLFMGLAFQTKYIAGFGISIIIIMELYLLFYRKQKLKETLWNIATVLSYFFIIFVLFLLIYLSYGIQYHQILLTRLSCIDVGMWIVNIIKPMLSGPITLCSAMSPFGENDITYGGHPFLAAMRYIYFMLSTFTFPLLYLFFFGIFVSIRCKKIKFYLLTPLVLCILFLIKLAQGQPRDLIFLVPFVVIFSAVGFYNLKLNRKSLISIGIVMIIILSFHSYNAITYTNRAQYRVSEFLLNDNVTGILSNTGNPIVFYTEQQTMNISHIVINSNYGYPEEYENILRFSKPVYKTTYNLERWRIPIWLKGTGINFFERHIQTDTINQTYTVYKIDPPGEKDR